MAKIIADRRISIDRVNDELGRKKANIRDSYNYFKSNYKRFNKFKKFVFDTSLSDEEVALNLALGKPTLEFNILEAYISRLRGEFARQEPSIEVRAADDAYNIDPKLEIFLEAHIRAILSESNRDNMEFDIYTDILAGGFSAIKIYTDYAHSMSFDQVIKLKKVYDPALTGFDKLARDSHKGDGLFCFEIYPRDRNEFEDQYGKSLTDKMTFTKNIEGFNWSYTSDTNNQIVLVCDYYEKKKSSAKIVKLVTGQTMLESDYELFVDNWNKQAHMFVAAPGIVGKPRKTDIVSITRTVMTEYDTLEYNETDYSMLPIIFVDGNSQNITNTSGTSMQMTRPYVYHAESIQKLKNFAGNTLANELENMIMSKMMIPKEGIPAEYKDAYINPQRYSVYIYNAYKDEDGQIPLPAPATINKPQTPPEVTNTFSLTDEITQAILGSYDASMLTNKKDLSGKAVIESATLSNAAAMPFIVNYMKGLNRASEIIVDLIPKYITTPRRMPVKSLGSNKAQYVDVNGNSGISLDYPPNSFNIKIEAGVNFEIQQQKAFQTLLQLMQISPIMNAYMSEEQGLQTLLDNIDIRGIDALKQGITQFSQQSKQMQQQAQQAQMQQAQVPLMIKQQEMQQNSQKIAMDYDIKRKQLEIQEQDSETRRLVGLATIGEKADKVELESAKLEAEQARTDVSSINAIANIADVSHKHAMDILHLHHDNDKFHKTLSKELSMMKSKQLEDIPSVNDKGE